jgi:hypothetical protein
MVAFGCEGRLPVIRIKPLTSCNLTCQDMEIDANTLARSWFTDCLKNCRRPQANENGHICSIPTPQLLLPAQG